MKKTSEILEAVRNHITSPVFENTYKSRPQDFTRKCIFSFSLIVSFTLQLIRKSLQVELYVLCQCAQKKFFSKQAFSAARKKVLPSAFRELTHRLNQEFYKHNKAPTFLGFRIVVIDGSTLQLPESQEIRDAFGVCTNGMEGKEMPMARISYAYDCLTGLTLDAQIYPYKTGEKDLAMEHMPQVELTARNDDLYVFDRGYPSIDLLIELNKRESNFVMRCKKRWMKQIEEKVDSGYTDFLITLGKKHSSPHIRRTFRKFFPNQEKEIVIRVVVKELKEGGECILLTSLTSEIEYTKKQIEEIYKLRWRVEENYKLHKIGGEIENFSGKTRSTVEQDFYATIFTINLMALLRREVELEEKQSKGECKQKIQINGRVGLGVVKREIQEALWDRGKDLSQICERIKTWMRKTRTIERKNRCTGKQTHRKRPTGKRYPINGKRAL